MNRNDMYYLDKCTKCNILLISHNSETRDRKINISELKVHLKVMVRNRNGYYTACCPCCKTANHIIKL